MGTIAACENPNATSSTTGVESPSTAAKSPAVSPTVSSSPSATGTISNVLAGNSSFSTLQAAVQAAGLQQTLSEAGPVTVLHPPIKHSLLYLSELSTNYCFPKIRISLKRY